MLVPATPPLPPLRELIPCPWSLAEFRVNVERHRNARLVITAAPLRRDISGLWIATTTGDLIIYNEAADPAQQLRAIGHQAAHLLLGHHATPNASASQVLFPHLASSLVAAVVPSFTPDDEMAADEFGSLLAARAWPTHSAQARPS